MIYFRNYQWLPVNGYRRFDAYIITDTRSREEVLWSLHLRYVLGGAAWRRVREWERLSLWLGVFHFNPKLHFWTDVERMNFWELDQGDELDLCGPGGYLDATFHPKAGSKEHETSFVNDIIWRVAGRQDGWFTLELAGFADGQSILDHLNGQKVMVTPDGKEAHYEPNHEFWKQHAELYLAGRCAEMGRCTGVSGLKRNRMASAGTTDKAWCSERMRIARNIAERRARAAGGSVASSLQFC